MKKLIVLFAMMPLALSAAEFGAYYTKIDSGDDFERFSRTGPDADIVVRAVGKDQGRLVFWRGSSYLPYWESAGGRKWFLKEMTPRCGDGPPQRPDKVNTYSVARIIESSARQVVIHWRYLPQFNGDNPHYNPTNLAALKSRIGDTPPAHLVTTDKFVDEYFTITPDGRVTRTFRQGTEKLADWTDPRNVTRQELNLTDSGMEVVSEQPPAHSPPAPPVKGNPVVDQAGGKPVKWWKFDEGAGDLTRESVAGDHCEIAGHRSYWKQGVSGTALAFDGYRSVVRLPADKAPAIAAAVTLEAWVALGAYPWNWTPVIQQGHEESYYLGIGPHGNVGITVKVGGKLVKLESTARLERKRWYHVAGTYDQASGALRLFIDGQPSGESDAGRGGIDRSTSPLQIGKGREMSQSDPVRANTFAADFSFDGLIDEVRIHDVALTPERVAAAHQAFKLPDAIRTKPDLDPRVLPAGLKTGKFGAYYTHLRFYDTWDGMFRFSDHPDVVVEFDKHPTSYVFWRGTGFIPMLVNEKGGWYSNEFNETWGRSGGNGCQEPMSDKEAFSNHVKILENTPARVVVQWRYPLVDVFHTIANYNPETGWGDWSDWIYTIYPDGVAAKRMRLWSTGPYNHEWQEGMVITGPDQHPEQVVETEPALVLATLDGETREYSWKNGPPRGVNYRDIKIHVINFKGAYDPFTIGDFEKGNVYGGEVTDYSVFPSWNHWPVAQMPSDGRYAKHPDRTAHSSLTHVTPPVYRNQQGDQPYQERLLLEGMSTLKPAELATLARSWLKAPPITAISGCKALDYDPSKREYPLVAEQADLTVSIAASAGQPLVNACFSVRNWGHDGAAKVTAKGAAARDIRQGTVIDTNGKRMLILWLELDATAPAEFTISGAEP